MPEEKIGKTTAVVGPLPSDVPPAPVDLAREIGTSEHDSLDVPSSTQSEKVAPLNEAHSAKPGPTPLHASDDDEFAPNLLESADHRGPIAHELGTTIATKSGTWKLTKSDSAVKVFEQAAHHAAQQTWKGTHVAAHELEKSALKRK